jgi:hypothetical protein
LPYRFLKKEFREKQARNREKFSNKRIHLQAQGLATKEEK